MVRLDDNKKTQVMKALFKKVREYVEKKNGKYALEENKRCKRVVFKLEDWVWDYMQKDVPLM